MKNEIEIYYDKEFKKIVGDVIEFEPIEVGKIIEKEIFIKSNVDFLIENIEIIISDEDVIVKNEIKNIKPQSYEKLILIYNTKITRRKPIRSSIQINGIYIIK